MSERMSERTSARARERERAHLDRVSASRSSARSDLCTHATRHASGYLESGAGRSSVRFVLRTSLLRLSASPLR